MLKRKFIIITAGPCARDKHLSLGLLVNLIFLCYHYIYIYVFDKINESWILSSYSVNPLLFVGNHPISREGGRIIYFKKPTSTDVWRRNNHTLSQTVRNDRKCLKGFVNVRKWSQTSQMVSNSRKRSQMVSNGRMLLSQKSQMSYRGTYV